MSLSQQAFDRIQKAIVSGALDFGERLSEMQIAEALGMSKAPVRTAFFKLRDIRLVNIVPQAGTYVFSPTRADVFEMSTFRAVLETAGLRLSMAQRPSVVQSELEATVVAMEKAIADADWKAYETADMDFHQVFIRNSSNSYLPQAFDLTASAIKALRVRLQGGEGGYRKQSYDEHKLILHHVQSQDVDKATKTLEEHIMVINSSSLELPAAGTVRSKGRTRTFEAYRELFR
ncbi:GntR family transcriptional regulator [Tritonibacter horizontis]|uniref:Transcriptional regulator NanR n=1 Tax=Tritonibacter horizontis TaxID=1768241 RepID=A0A132BSS3_9RHOB|nr:GntR family transcriptional regulator [Tritonibacter horizontis]KUP90800.1 transcriptional regulator NanR [Tritonibacter horizontis]